MREVSQGACEVHVHNAKLGLSQHDFLIDFEFFHSFYMSLVSDLSIKFIRILKINLFSHVDLEFILEVGGGLVPITASLLLTSILLIFLFEPLKIDMAR